MRVLLSRWHVEKWLERARQEVGLGAFEVRTYTSLLRHGLCVRVAMAFLAEQTARLRGKNPRITFEQVSEASSTLADKLWHGNWRSRAELLHRAAYHHRRLLRRPTQSLPRQLLMALSC